MMLPILFLMAVASLILLITLIRFFGFKKKLVSLTDVKSNVVQFIDNELTPQQEIIYYELKTQLKNDFDKIQWSVNGWNKSSYKKIFYKC